MKNVKNLKETIDNKTYNICHFGAEDLCCRKCINRHRRVWYHQWDNGKKVTTKLPNWKLVSKNKKQWMKKPLKIETKESKWFPNATYTTYKW